MKKRSNTKPVDDKYKDYVRFHSLALDYVHKHPGMIIGLRYVCTLEKLRIHKDDCEIFQDRFSDIILAEMQSILKRDSKD